MGRLPFRTTAIGIGVGETLECNFTETMVGAAVGAFLATHRRECPGNHIRGRERLIDVTLVSVCAVYACDVTVYPLAALDPKGAAGECSEITLLLYG